MKLCVVEDCSKRATRRGMCEPHYRRFMRHGDPLAGNTTRGEPLKYLHEVVLTYGRHDCLIWPYCRSSGGYATMRYKGRTDVVCRIVCTEVHGNSPSSALEVAHSCGNGHLGCVNPNHLRWATKAENCADKLAHGTLLRGERAFGAKLTERDVHKIRSLAGKVSCRRLADEFGVSDGTIVNIQKRRAWAWLADEASRCAA